MPKIERTALVMHSAKAMYGLVNDVLSYPRFLPWCSQAKVLSESPDTMVASLEISKGKMHQKFVTRNLLIENERIEMNLEEGPFKRLEGVWQFTPLNDHACKVAFYLDFEFAGRFGAMALGSVFNNAANTMVDVFCKRANEVYGRN